MALNGKLPSGEVSRVLADLPTPKVPRGARKQPEVPRVHTFKQTLPSQDLRNTHLHFMPIPGVQVITVQQMQNKCSRSETGTDVFHTK